MDIVSSVFSTADDVLSFKKVKYHNGITPKEGAVILCTVDVMSNFDSPMVAVTLFLDFDVNQKEEPQEVEKDATIVGFDDLIPIQSLLEDRIVALDTFLQVPDSLGSPIEGLLQRLCEQLVSHHGDLEVLQGPDHDKIVFTLRTGAPETYGLLDLKLAHQFFNIKE